MRVSASRARFSNRGHTIQLQKWPILPEVDSLTRVLAETKAVPASQAEGFLTEGEAEGRKPERLAQPPQIIKRIRTPGAVDQPQNCQEPSGGKMEMEN